MPRKLLVIYSAASTIVATTMEYVRSFGRYSRNTVSYIHGTHNARLGVGLDEFDAVWLNYCCRLCFPGYVSPDVRDALRTYRGLKLMSVQDEYDRTETLRQGIEDLGFDVVFTCVPQNALHHVYPRERLPRTEFITVLTGYVPEHLEQISKAIPLERRPIVIGYRGRDVGGRYGELGFWKVEIGRRMKAMCLERGIHCDIEVAEEARIYGERWYAFVGACRTMLGSESGSNVFDFDGSIERQYKTLKGAKPRLSYEEFRPYVADRERDIGMGQISPRMFEAAALRTPMILLTGRYSGLIQPGEHYIELRKDFANVGDVLRQVEDIGALDAIAERAYRDLISSGAYSYRRFIELVDEVTEQKLSERERPAEPIVANPSAGGRALQEEPGERSDLMELPTLYPLDMGDYYLKNERAQLAAEIDGLRTRLATEIDGLHARLNSALRDARAGELAKELVRRALVRLLGGRRGPIAWRLREDPGGLFTKAYVSVRAISVYPLRALLFESLTDRKVRRQVGYRRLLTDLLKLEIVRRARRGVLAARERFCIRVIYDPAGGVVTLKSVPIQSGLAGNGGSELRDEGSGSCMPSELLAALRRGQVTSVLWDHSVFGSQVVCEVGRSRCLTVFVGADGVHRFDALVELARRRPSRVAGILASILGGEPTRRPGATALGDSSGESRED